MHVLESNRSYITFDKAFATPKSLSTSQSGTTPERRFLRLLDFDACVWTTAALRKRESEKRFCIYNFSFGEKRGGRFFGGDDDDGGDAPAERQEGRFER